MSPMPPEADEPVDAPGPCWRYPTCEGYLDDPQNPYPGDCTWPDCVKEIE
jgi:hypothetical protein